MTDTQAMIDVLDRRVERRNERRDFFKTALGAVAVAGASGLFYADPALAQAAPSDFDVLNFALNLEYLEANFYSYAVYGTPISAALTTGVGTPGVVMPGHIVPFSDPVVAQYAKEIAQDEIAHVTFLRSVLTTMAVAQPAIDLGIAPTGAFSTAARAAGLISKTDMTAFFDPYMNDTNFLLGSFIFEDVGVTAYKGASPLITNKTYLEAAAGILAVEAYHASIVRTVLYAKGIRTQADAISDARDSLDGTSDDDQGISPVNVPLYGTNGMGSNIVPLDANGLAYSRTTGQVLNVVYLNNKAVTMGGFFPAGVNGAIKQSAAN
ncbi:MAG: ferritin-like domain-containing protein [Pseudomonadota bacterium]|nr:ferritin-like domain-containing protein [Pseudomonadota bacterium]